MIEQCTVTPDGGIPTGCAAIIETAAGMMMFGDRDIGRKMLEDLLLTASRSGCGSRPHCSAVIERVSALLLRCMQEDEQDRKRA